MNNDPKQSILFIIIYYLKEKIRLHRTSHFFICFAEFKKFCGELYVFETGKNLKILQKQNMDGYYHILICFLLHTIVQRIIVVTWNFIDFWRCEGEGISEVNKLSLGILLLCWWRSHCRNLRILQGCSSLTLKDGAAVREWSSLVGLFRELALRIGFGQGATILHELQQVASLLAFWFHARRTATERWELPCLTRLYSGTPSGGKAHSWEVCNREVVTCYT